MCRLQLLSPPHPPTPPATLAGGLLPGFRFLEGLQSKGFDHTAGPWERINGLWTKAEVVEEGSDPSCLPQRFMSCESPSKNALSNDIAMVNTTTILS